MKNKHLVLGLVCLLFCCVDEVPVSYPKDVEFYVTGTKGLPFSGSYGNLSSTSSVDGVIPQSYYAELEDEYDRVSGVFQKSAESGTLTIEIYVDNNYKKSASTWASYGTVSISYSE